MHQSHNIPWHIFTNHYKPTRNSHIQSHSLLPNHSIPNPISILPLRTPQISQDVNHFIRKFSETVRSFAKTERSKYPDRLALLGLGNGGRTSGKLFSDELRDMYPGILDEENQRIERWIAGPDFHHLTSPYHHDPNIKPRAELICFFLHENLLLPLLILANHPQFSVSDLIERNLDQWKEFSHVKSAAIRAYVLFNVLNALGMFATGEYAECQEYRNVIQNIAKERDYEGQDTIHTQFLRQCDILQENGEINWDNASRLHDKENYEILGEYLKDSFALIYRYEMFFREERGADPKLEWELSHCSPISTPSGIANPFVFCD